MNKFIMYMYGTRSIVLNAKFFTHEKQNVAPLYGRTVGPHRQIVFLVFSTFYLEVRNIDLLN